MPSQSAIDKLKMMIDATVFPVVTDAEVAVILSNWAIADADGNYSPAEDWNWFDFNGAAEDGWNIKAGRSATIVDSNSDGQDFSSSQLRMACEDQARKYLAKRQTGFVGVSTGLEA
jgi:hypothetical protein